MVKSTTGTEVGIVDTRISRIEGRAKEVGAQAIATFAPSLGMITEMVEGYSHLDRRDRPQNLILFHETLRGVVAAIVESAYTKGYKEALAANEVPLPELQQPSAHETLLEQGEHNGTSS